jgi:hypothetical protein
MKPRWLLLGASVLCLLVLFPASALSQGHRVNAGCGTATIDGYVGDSEWATAATAPLYEYELEVESAEAEAMDFVGASASQLRVGTAYLMNDGRFLYLGAVLDDPNDEVPDNATKWGVDLRFAFEDEPADDPAGWVDCAWEATSCNQPEDEGILYGWTQATGVDSQLAEGLWFGHAAAPHIVCNDSPQFSGVTHRGLPQGSGAHVEMRVNLNTSPLNNPRAAAGDCFDLRWLYVNFPSQDPAGFLGAGWPSEPVDEAPYAGECTVLCLNPCAAEEVVEEQFVPEPASLMLLGSGLAGLAGYAALRWRSTR